MTSILNFFMIKFCTFLICRDDFQHMSDDFQRRKKTFKLMLDINIVCANIIMDRLRKETFIVVLPDCVVVAILLETLIVVTSTV